MTIEERTLHFPVHAVYGPDGTFVAAFASEADAEAFEEQTTDDAIAAMCAAEVARLMEEAGHIMTNMDYDLPESCSCGAAFYDGFNLQAVKRAHVSHFIQSTVAAR